MNLLYRRLLYSCFILLFLIITPLISFYAAGYTVNSVTKGVERTSILIVETTPKGATVDLGPAKKYNWLYNILRGDTTLATPLKLRNVLPGNYDITVAKDGYFDYRARIQLLPGQTTVADNITLLKNVAPELVMPAQIIKTALSPDGSKLAAIGTSTLHVITLNTGRTTSISLDDPIGSETALEIVWSPHNDMIMLAAGVWPVFNVERATKITEVQKHILIPLTRARWHDSDDNTLLLTAANAVYSFNISNQTKTALLVVDGLQDALLRDDALFTLEKNTTLQNRLALYQPDTAALLKVTALPPAVGYRFLENASNTLYVYEPQHDWLYIIDPASFVPLRDSIGNVGDFNISPNGMIYWNDFELWTYDIDNATQNLLTRISTRINSAALTESYAIYAAAHALTALELAHHDYRNIQPLLEWSDTGELVLSTNTKYLYFTSPLESGRGLYRLEI